jgi:hypothetical protein
MHPPQHVANPAQVVLHFKAGLRAAAGGEITGALTLKRADPWYIVDRSGTLNTDVSE